MHRLDFDELTRQLANLYDFFETSDPEDAALTACSLNMYRQNALYAVSNDAHHLSIADMKLHLFVSPTLRGIQQSTVTQVPETFRRFFSLWRPTRVTSPLTATASIWRLACSLE